MELVINIFAIIFLVIAFLTMTVVVIAELIASYLELGWGGPIAFMVALATGGLIWWWVVI